MDNVVQVLDVAAAILIIISLNMVTRNYKWWLLYSAADVIFSMVTISKRLPGLTVMGLVLCVTGIINYRREKRKKENENPIS